MIVSNWVELSDGTVGKAMNTNLLYMVDEIVIGVVLFGYHVVQLPHGAKLHVCIF